MAARLAVHAAGARKADHLAADVTGDGFADLVVAAIGADEVFSVTLSTWDGHHYTDRGRITAAAPDRVGTPALRDLDGDGRAEVLAPYISGAEAGVVVAAVADDASLVLPVSCPLTSPSPYQLRLRPGRAAAVVLACQQDDPGQVEAGALLLRWNGRQFAGDAASDPVPDASEPVPDASEPVPDASERPEPTSDHGPRGRVDRPSHSEREERTGGRDPQPGRGDDPPGRGRGPDGEGPPGRVGRG